MKNIVYALRYLFYRSYTHQLTRWKGDEKTSAIAATGLIAIAIFTNVYALFIFAMVITGEPLLPNEMNLPLGLPSIRVGYLVAIFVLLFAQMLYSFFVRKDRYKKIVVEFSLEEPAERKRHAGYIYMYVIITIALYIASLVSTAWSN
jgi:hypothetical protein